MSEEKKLRDGERRFVVKTRIIGRKTVYNVYDRAVGSYPKRRPDTGVVPENMPDLEQAEAMAIELEARRQENPKGQ